MSRPSWCWRSCRCSPSSAGRSTGVADPPRVTHHLDTTSVSPTLRVAKWVAPGEIMTPDRNTPKIPLDWSRLLGFDLAEPVDEKSVPAKLADARLAKLGA